MTYDVYEDLRSKAQGVMYEVIGAQNLSQTQKAVLSIMNLIIDIIEQLDVEGDDEE